MSGNILTEARLRLRPVTRTDLERIYRWYQDPRLMSLYDGIQFTVDDREIFGEEFQLFLETDVEMNLSGMFIMEEKSTGEAIGECTWMQVMRTGPDSPGIFQVGGLIGPEGLRGKGYGTEALHLLRDYLFTEMEAHRLEAMTTAFNTGAMKTLHRNGFVREGVLREAVLVDGKWQDRVLFSLLRQEWEQGARPQQDFPHD